jgi:hypothetical protein
MLMTAPGVGTIVALTFRSAVDDSNGSPTARAAGAMAAAMSVGQACSFRRRIVDQEW